MKKYDFDKVVDRKNTLSLKYDFAVQRGRPADILPLWVADMDFQAPDEVVKVLTSRSTHGIFGYSEPDDTYFNTIKAWYERRFSYSPKKEWFITAPGIVYSLAMVVRALTQENDGVLIQTPVYYPFYSVIKDNNRRVVRNPLKFNGESYEMDFDDFEEKLVKNNVKLFILCSPHNPVGRVWTKDELNQVGNICKKHNVYIACDEIHADFVYKGNNHHVFSTVNEDFRKFTVILTSPSKTFNLAGLQLSNLFIENDDIRSKINMEIRKTGYSQCNIMGIISAQAAYQYGEGWLEQLLDYLQNNINKFTSFINEKLPMLKVIKPQGTYLLWVDFKGLGISENQRQDLIVNKARLWLDKGTMFGAEGEGFERFNIACPWSTLEKALIQLQAAINNYNKKV